MRRVVVFSGGIGSWAVARRAAGTYGTADLVLVFAETGSEDEDLYRFLGQAAAQMGAPLVRLADGRTPWQVFTDEHFIGNARVAPCSKQLKQVPCCRWLESHTVPDETIVYVGIDWSEIHRLPAIQRGYWPWRAEASLCEPPWVSKAELIEEARAAGLEPPRLYRLGFPHNNCGGACVRAGQATWAHLLRVFPDRYRYHERQEQALRDRLGKDVAILRDRSNGAVRPLTLRELRHRLDRQPAPAGEAALDWGGCGCLPTPGTDCPSTDAAVSSRPRRAQRPVLSEEGPVDDEGAAS